MTRVMETLATTLAATLAPRVERGATALLASGTRTRRAALVDAAVAALSALPTPPVVVRLGPERAPGARLDEALTLGVEAALDGLGAPGALYDDPRGGPLASLAGWLFRARTVGRRGVVLVLEEVDGWVNPEGRDEPSRTLAACLEESGLRGLSVLATARAGEASGAPALPDALVARFGEVHALGGPPTVTRDPWTLVAALSGRALSLPDLKGALAAWLELPEAPSEGSPDDTLIVFGAPLAPPALPSLAPLPWPGEAREGDGARGGEAARGVTLRAEALVPERDTHADSKRWAGALRAAVRVRERARALSVPPKDGDFRAWERAYTKTAARLPEELLALAEGEAAVGVGPTRVRAEAAAALARFERAFGEFYRGAAGGWASGGARPTMLCDLPGRLTRHAESVGARSALFLVCAGLRWDLWERLKARVLPSVAALALSEEGALWAARPTTPGAQRALLARGLGEGLGEGAPSERGEAVPPATLEDALSWKRERLGAVEVLRLEAYAAALSVPGATLEGAAESVESRLAGALGAALGGVSGRVAVALAGDVGWRAESSGGAEARWSFGGDSPFEVVVPYALLTWC